MSKLKFPIENIKKIEFTLLSAKEMDEIAYADIKIGTNSYERGPVAGSLYDGMMGTTSGYCKLCKNEADDDIGHLGKITLTKPVINTLFIKEVQSVLNMVCIRCRAVMIKPEKREEIMKLNPIYRESEIKATIGKNRKCPICGYSDNFSYSINKTKKYLISYKEKEATYNIAPEYILEIFKSMTDADVELIGYSKYSRPEYFIWSSILVPSIPQRPPIQDGEIRSEDSINTLLKNIHKYNLSLMQLNKVKTQIYDDHKFYVGDFQMKFEVVQSFVAAYIANSANSSDSLSYMKTSEKIKSIAEILKGKEGKIRQDVSSKRLIQTLRGVISPNPDLPIDVLEIPEDSAKILTKPVFVTVANQKEMESYVRNGIAKYVGAYSIIKHGETEPRILIGEICSTISVEVGDLVARNVIDGDICVFNRQPSLHKYSMMAFRLKIVPNSRKISFNPCDCKPFNADFDGDEMVCHIPQSVKSATECKSLMYVHRNIISDAGSMLIGLIQNNIIGMYLVSKYFGKKISNKLFYDLVFASNIGHKKLIARIKACDGYKTGEYRMEHVIECILPAGITINEKTIKIINGRIQKTNYVTVKKAVSNIDTDQKMLLGKPNVTLDNYVDGGKDSDDNFENIDVSKVVYQKEPAYPLFDAKIINNILIRYIYNNYSNKTAAKFISAMIGLSTRFNTIHGFTNTVSDITLGTAELAKIKQIIVTHHEKYAKLMLDFEQKKIPIPINRSPRTVFESMVLNLDAATQKETEEIVGEYITHNGGCFNDLIRSGAKGEINFVRQIASNLGRQDVKGARYDKSLGDRSLPHQPKYDDDPMFGGYAVNSFSSGMNPVEDYIHSASNRLALAELTTNLSFLGYNSRKLLTTLQDVYIANDNICRKLNGKIISFQPNGCGFNNKALSLVPNLLVNMTEKEYEEEYVW